MPLFGRYEYVAELGRGTTGRVFAARDLAADGAPRALKVVSASESGRLLWEFSRLSRVEHRRVARVRELLRAEHAVPGPFALAAKDLVLVEDRAFGTPLGLVLESLPPQPALRLPIVLQAALGIAEALSAVHDVGLVHGDVKPDNVLWEPAHGATLVDLGFARAPSLRAKVRGTPAFMAPELLSGVCTKAADIFALGGLIFDALLPEGHASGSSSGSGSQTAIAGARAPEGLLRSDLPREVVGLVASFLERDPELRVRDGRAALSALIGLLRTLRYAVDPESVRFASMLGEATPRERAQRARTLPFLGHDGLIQEVAQALDTALNPESMACWLELRAPRGAGSTRLAREVLRVLNEQRAQKGRSLPTAVYAVSSLSGLRDVDCILTLERPDQEACDQALRAQTAFATRGRKLCVVLEGGEVSYIEAPPSALRFSMGALDWADFQALVARLLAPRRTAEALSAQLHRATRGLAGLLCDGVARALAEGADPLDPERFAASGETGLSGWSKQAWELAVFLAWSAEPVREHEGAVRALGGLENILRGADELRARGAASDEGASLQLSAGVAREVRALGHGEWTVRFAADFLSSGLACPAQSPFLAAALGRTAESVEGFLAEAKQRVARGQYESARSLLAEANEVVDAPELKLQLAELERKRAHYRQARAGLRDVVCEEAIFQRAELSRLMGDPQAARGELEKLKEGHWRERALAIMARLAYDAADYASAKELLVACEGATDELARLRAGEVHVLLSLAQGGANLAHLHELVGRAERFGDPRMLARALALRAYASSLSGQRLHGRADLLRAVELTKSAGELHEYATYGLNAGLVELEEGQLGDALEHLREAAYTLAWIDRPSDLVRVLFNLGNASLLLGDDEHAEWVLLEAARMADVGVDFAARAMVSVSRSELHLRRGQFEAATQLLEHTLEAVPRDLSQVRGLVVARAGLVYLLRGQIERAQALCDAERAAHHGELGLEFAVLDVRMRLSSGNFTEARAMAESAVVRSSQASFSLRVRLLLAASDAEKQYGAEEAARNYLSVCRGLLERALAGLSPGHRARMRRVPEFARVLSAQTGTQVVELAENPERWRALVRGGRRLFAETRPRRIAARLTELALDLVHAERALVVRESGDELRVLACTELSGEPGRELPFSNSVVRRVFSDQGPVVSLEAVSDERFDQAKSVHALNLRSVVAVPLEGLAERAVLYLDDRLRASAFGADDQAILLDLAELARQALRVGHERVEQQRRAQLATQQEKKLARQLAELSLPVAVQENLPFVGMSEPLRKLTETAQRVSGSTVPVVIQGPSGTGKELLARFIHNESQRRAAPFIAENCAALPDPMLESALFGHVRGAFTGADRARRGLFELADGGTLLLDEVAEMSPAMQGKLLRVLQEGEFRALGSEKLRKVDVRVIAASHQNLYERVQAGLFREDLFYRLAVVTLLVPALSERREDIPLLVHHFLHKHGAGRSVRVSPEAMRAWETRDYPGNIRQLENEVRRALALSDGDIGADHIESLLPASRTERAVHSLELHAQTEALTRKLVEVAMERTRGNVSQAAQLLGVSRFGLQKILKRFSPEAN